jgi:hypothetical protein
MCNNAKVNKTTLNMQAANDINGFYVYGRPLFGMVQPEFVPTDAPIPIGTPTKISGKGAALSEQPQNIRDFAFKMPWRVMIGSNNTIVFESFAGEAVGPENMVQRIMEIRLRSGEKSTIPKEITMPMEYQLEHGRWINLCETPMAQTSVPDFPLTSAEAFANYKEKLCCYSSFCEVRPVGWETIPSSEPVNALRDYETLLPKTRRRIE